MKPILVFQTDFTYQEGAVAAMYGVVKSVDPSLEIVTATHEIPKFDIWSASYRLVQYGSFWPRGTVFVSVVDPGVGTSRKACAARTANGYYVVIPDNGTLTHVKKEWGIREVRQIDEAVNRYPYTRGTSVFHGRDLFGYCAARLAAGIIDFPGVGPAYDPGQIVTFPLEEPVIREGCAEGIIEIADPNFGNLWSNIPAEGLEKAGMRCGDMVRVHLSHGEETVFDGAVRFGKTFGEVEEGMPVLYSNERMNASLALCRGSFLQAYHAWYGPDWKLKVTR